MCVCVCICLGLRLHLWIIWRLSTVHAMIWHLTQSKQIHWVFYERSCVPTCLFVKLSFLFRRQTSIAEPNSYALLILPPHIPIAPNGELGGPLYLSVLHGRVPPEVKPVTSWPSWPAAMTFPATPILVAACLPYYKLTDEDISDNFLSTVWHILSSGWKELPL